MKLAAARAASGSGVRYSSALADLLVSDWSWGQISTPMLQKVAPTAMLDFEASGISAPKQLESLATIGSSGKHVGNMHRDLVEHRLKAPILKPALSTFGVLVE